MVNRNQTERRAGNQLDPQVMRASSDLCPPPRPHLLTFLEPSRITPVTEEQPFTPRTQGGHSRLQVTCWAPGTGHVFSTLCGPGQWSHFIYPEGQKTCLRRVSRVRGIRCGHCGMGRLSPHSFWVWFLHIWMASLLSTSQDHHGDKPAFCYLEGLRHFPPQWSQDLAPFLWFQPT